MVKWAFFTLFGIFLVLGLYLYVYLGVSQPVTLALQKRGPFTLIYKNHLGPYHTINKSIQRVEEWAQRNKIDCTKTFGEYLDDPHSADEDRLRSRAGCLLTADLPSGVTIPEGFEKETRAESSYVVGQFAGSPAVGPYTVYPKALAMIERERMQSRGPVIEVYEVSSDAFRTEYLFPVAGGPASD